MRICLLILLITIVNTASGQKKYGQNWVTGGGISYKVNFADTINITYYDTNFVYYFGHGTSCISNDQQKLLFTTNGFQLYDTLGEHIENGDSLIPSIWYNKYNGFSLLDQSSIILPIDSNRYLLFTPTISNKLASACGNSCQFDLLLAHKIDMNANGGKGKVVQKAMPLLENTLMSKTQMMACRHSSAQGWWLFKQASVENKIYKFLVTSDGVYNMGSQTFAQPVWSIYDLAGQSMFNQTGTQYATTSSSLTANDNIFLADFDRCNGLLSNPKVYNIPDLPSSPTKSDLDVAPGGICFSPNGRFLYLTKFWNIFQLDLQETDSAKAWYHVANLDTTENLFMGYGNAYIGPDNKVYIGNWGGLSAQMSYIANPDVKGVGCNFCPRCLRFPKRGVFGVPCMPNYGLMQDSSKNCPLPIPGPVVPIADWEVFPNPATDKLYFKNAIGKKKVLYNGFGQILLSTIKDEMDVSHFAMGLYYLRCEGRSKKVIIE